jgi:hypothetical protein
MATGDFQTRVSSLRAHALELLQDFSDDRRAGAGSRVDIVTELQAVNSSLALVQRELSRGASRPPIRAASRKPRLRHHPVAALSGDAAAVLGLAESIVRLANSKADEAERWLRLLRDHGIVGGALRAVGVPSGQFQPQAAPVIDGARVEDPVEAVAEAAADLAVARGAQTTSTIDLLFAVFERYGRLFDRALYGAAAATREQLLVELSRSTPAVLQDFRR